MPRPSISPFDALDDQLAALPAMVEFTDPNHNYCYVCHGDAGVRFRPGCYPPNFLRPLAEQPLPTITGLYGW